MESLEISPDSSPGLHTTAAAWMTRPSAETSAETGAETAAETGAETAAETGTNPSDEPGAGPGDGVGGLDGPGAPAAGHAPERDLQRRLLGFARRFLRDRTEAEDMMQEALLRARQSELRLRTPDRAEAWLFRICRHAAIDHRRARKVREGVWQPLSEERAQLIAAPPAMTEEHGPSQAVRALRTLPAHHRVLMSLHYERGLPQGAICQLTGLSTSALRVRLFRARGVLSVRGEAASGDRGVKRRRLAVR